MNLAARARHWLESRSLPLMVGAVAVALCAPSLGLGLLVDDYFLEFALRRPAPLPEWSRGWLDLFVFFDGSPALVARAMETGAAPWWTDAHLRAAFFRPLTGATHWLDFRCWPNAAWAMHAQSLLWFGATIVAAAHAYRRFLQPAWVAGLAALLFALDDAHGVPASWLANRNATIATVLAVLTITAHDRWRRGAWTPGRVAAPALFGAALLGGEGAIGTCGYLAAYALFIDRGRWPGRLASLAPAAIVVLTWSAVYRAAGFGVTGSAMYIDPGSSPAAFARAVFDRAPLLFFGQWALPSGLHMLLSQDAQFWFWLAGWGALLGIGLLVAPVVVRSPAARFFATGMVVSLVPACGTFPDDRLLFLSGFGGMGLLAALVGSWREPPPGRPLPHVWQKAARAAVPTLLVIHVVIAPVLLAGSVDTLRRFGAVFSRAAESLPAPSEGRGQTAIIVNTPSAFVSTYGPVIQAHRGRAIPRRTLILSSGIGPVSVRRTAPDVLVVRPAGDFLQTPGAPFPHDDSPPPVVDRRYMFGIFDHLYRNTPIPLGYRADLATAVVRVTRLTDDGRPAEVEFHFASSLDAPALTWLQWRDGAYVPFGVPQVGSQVTLPEVTVPF